MLRRMAYARGEPNAQGMRGELDVVRMRSGDSHIGVTRTARREWRRMANSGNSGNGNGNGTGNRQRRGNGWMPPAEDDPRLQEQESITWQARDDATATFDALMRGEGAGHTSDTSGDIEKMAADATRAYMRARRQESQAFPAFVRKTDAPMVSMSEYEVWVGDTYYYSFLNKLAYDIGMTALYRHRIPPQTTPQLQQRPQPSRQRRVKGA